MPYSYNLELKANYVLQVQMVPAIVKIFIDGIPKGASVQINDKQYNEKTPWTGMEFAPGTHQIVVSHPVFNASATTETKQASEELRIQYSLLPKKVTIRSEEHTSELQSRQ